MSVGEGVAVGMAESGRGLALFASDAKKGGDLVPVWIPPIGIPQPSFGIMEVAPALPSPWASNVTNFYYVDFATGDDSNTPGNPTAPRKTIPKVLATSGAPIVVVIAGSTYTQNQTSPNQLTWTGTAAAPIYLRGLSNGVRGALDALIDIEASAYVILEYLTWAQTGTGKQALGIYTLNSATDHVVARHCDMTGNATGSSPTAAIGIASFHASLVVNNIVLWDVAVHDFGDPAAVGDPDFHGIGIAQGSGQPGVHHVWVLDSLLHHNQGDGLQITNAILADQEKMHHFYVGRTTSHHNRQSGLWTKSAQDVVFSQNVIYGHRPGTSSGGAGTGAQYGPERVWYLFNHLYDNECGIAFGSDSGLGEGTHVYLIGNLIHDCGPLSPVYDPADVFAAVGGVYSLTVVAARHVINNTIWNCCRGVTNTDASTGAMHLVNTLIGAPTYANDHTIFNTNATSADASDMKNNLTRATERISWGQATVETLAQFQARTGKGQNCLTSDPLFVSGADFRLQASSPAKDAGIVDAVYAAFFDLYGIDLAKDVAGVIRPQNGVWDIGAYEYVG